MLRFEEGEVAAAAERGARAGEYHAARVGIAIQVVPDVEQWLCRDSSMTLCDRGRLIVTIRTAPSAAIKSSSLTVGFLATAPSCFFGYVSVNSEVTVTASSCTQPRRKEVPR